MKTTDYFERRLQDRPEIQLIWVEQALKNAIKREVQEDGRIRLWLFVAELDKYLRVVLLEDGETVHNAFFDRGFKPEETSE